MNIQIKDALNREVSRKEFLTLSGLMVGSVFGLGGFIKLLIGHDLHNRLGAVSPAHQASEYNSGAYGG